MGIYDRDYYREDAGGGWADWRGVRVTLSLITLIVAPFLAELFGSDPRQPGDGPVVAVGGFDAARIQAGELWRLVTFHFVHDRGAFVQVVLVGVALYVVAGRLEGVHGWREFLGFVICAAAVISLAKFVAAVGGDLDRLPGRPGLTYGAGPLVASLLVLYACHHPYEPVNLGVSVPMWAVVGGVVGLSLLAEFGGSGHAGRVAHLAGAAFAVAYSAAGWRVSNVLFPRTLAARVKVRPANVRAATDGPPAVTPRPAPIPTPRPAEAGVSRLTDEQLEAKLDQVLEKVARTGRDSLTTDEQAVLQRASEVFKQRRK